ncbi:hypothetical protein H3N56_11165 [Cetobacterium sp. 2A]|uniref:hypothetical protein n=1 Tax=Cetobacterium sp. 2A TaxID=2754723 RepID=UPI00163D19A8|nr:hypothetical protein [Cetobacterium sp. 2A]MBC2856992.1 hypothetical protein [Cetobacterium sp. 2A]
MGELTLIRRRIKAKEKVIVELKRNIKKLYLGNRKKRKIKLIELGTLFSILSLLDEEQEEMIGFLNEYKKLSSLKKEKLFFEGEEILLAKKETKYSSDKLEKRNMFYKMIRKGALLEKLKIHLENPRIILGFLNKYTTLSLEEKMRYRKKGEMILKKEVSTISNENKMELLRISIENRIDLTRILREKYNKNIHTLKLNEYSEVLNILKINK